MVVGFAVTSASDQVEFVPAAAVRPLRVQPLLRPLGLFFNDVSIDCTCCIPRCLFQVLGRVEFQ